MTFHYNINHNSTIKLLNFLPDTNSLFKLNYTIQYFLSNSDNYLKSTMRIISHLTHSTSQTHHKTTLHRTPLRHNAHLIPDGPSKKSAGRAKTPARAAPRCASSSSPAVGLAFHHGRPGFGAPFQRAPLMHSSIMAALFTLRRGRDGPSA